jgi:hypothetical protein
MKHMCSWSGGTKKCGRCGDGYCNYHFEINNGGASGGHECWCDEGRKNPLFGRNCKGTSFWRCPECNQRVCHYHGPPNNGGSVGGHNGCKKNAKKCAVVVGGLTCGGKVSQCADCEYTFCSNHIKGGLVNGTNGHACDLGCDTTTYTKVNCVGKRKDLITCKLCKKAGNNYKYCSYHAMPVRTLVSLGAEGDKGGGHVCQGYTTGSMLFGDNFGDLFLLVTDMAVTVATAGSVNPAAATIAGNSVKIVIHEVLDMIGIQALFDLRPQIMAQVEKMKKNKRDQEVKKLPKPVELDKSDTKELIANLKKISNCLKKYNKKAGEFFDTWGKKVEDLSKAGKEVMAQVQGIINALDKATTVIELAQLLKSTIDKLTKALVKPINPLKVIDATKECNNTLQKFGAACGA